MFEANSDSFFLSKIEWQRCRSEPRFSGSFRTGYPVPETPTGNGSGRQVELEIQVCGFRKSGANVIKFFVRNL
jgi:hypothetical protein